MAHGRGLIAVMLLLSGAGCSTLGALQSELPWSEKKKREAIEAVQPVRMVTYWSEMVYNKGGAPIRGFGGRLYFYNKFGKPVKVVGELSVYAYDDTDKTPQTVSRSEPEFTYVYKKEEFANYYSKSEIGESYSVWLPWDAVGGEEREISLLPKFVDQHGNIVTGEMSLHTLPGKKPKSKAEPLSDSQRFLKKQLEAQYGKDADLSGFLIPQSSGEWVNPGVREEIQSHRKLSSKSIPLSPDVARAIQNAPPPAATLDSAGAPRATDEPLPPPQQQRPAAPPVQRPREEDFVETPRYSQISSGALTADEAIENEMATDRMVSVARSRRFHSLPRQLPPSLSARVQADPSLPATSPSPVASRSAHSQAPQAQVRERTVGESELERKPSWMAD